MNTVAKLVVLVILAVGYSPTASAQKIQVCSTTASLNAAIVSQIKTVIGKQVDRGECWDLAAVILNKLQAKWDHDYAFGKALNYKKGDCLQAGDIIQFEGVVLQHQEGTTIYKENLKHHTAIIYAVSANGDIQLAQQNTGTHGKIVSIDPFNFSWIQKGKVMVYRPTK